MIVEEIDVDGNIYAINTRVSPKWTRQEDYVIFVLQKQNWTTIAAINAIRKQLRISKRRISFAGTKDRNAITTQLCSVYKETPNRLSEISLKDIAILGAWYWDRPIKLGDLLGNKFKIKLKSVPDREKIYTIYYAKNALFPNFYGPQRFGKRNNTHVVGKKILIGDFEGAVMEYLTTTGPDESAEVVSARRELRETQDYKAALQLFPKYLRYERALLGHLVLNPRDFVGALRSLPRMLLFMFLHAYQAYLFNLTLERKLRNGKLVEEGDYYCSANWYGFPDISKVNGKFPVGKLIGYASKLSETEHEVLTEENISAEQFKVKSMPELSTQGGYRPLLIPLKNFSYADGNFTFELPAGSYATVVIKEFLNA